MVLQTTGTLEAGNRRESVQWQLGGGNSVRTRPSLGIGSKSSGGHGRRFSGSTQSPESSSQLARWTMGDILKPG